MPTLQQQCTPSINFAATQPPKLSCPSGQQSWEPTFPSFFPLELPIALESGKLFGTCHHCLIPVKYLSIYSSHSKEEHRSINLMLTITLRVGLATASVFRSLQVRSERKWSEESVLNDVLNYGIVPDSKLLFTNDLEDPAFSLYPLLGNIKQCILEALEDRNSGIIGCSMSGSGSTIFALSSSPHTNLRPEWVSKVLSSFPFVSYYRCELLRRSPNLWY